MWRKVVNNAAEVVVGLFLITLCVIFVVAVISRIWEVSNPKQNSPLLNEICHLEIDGFFVLQKYEILNYVISNWQCSLFGSGKFFGGSRSRCSRKRFSGF